MRCDRVDFGPGGIAYRHTHPGPGTRYLLFGEITIDSEGAKHTYGPGQPWFERGPDRVLATTAADEPSAFVRVMLLPVEWAGQRTIKYVDPADAEKPKTQRATIFLEQPVRR
jgi:quercetin dioxygenase-like cupin family protein